jgi:hypothetical protein
MCDKCLLQSLILYCGPRFKVFFNCKLGSGEIAMILFFNNVFLHDMTVSSGPGPPHYRVFTITNRHTTVGRTPLDEWSAPCRDLYLTTHNNHYRETSMLPDGFEPAIPARKRPQTYALNRAATETGQQCKIISLNFLYSSKFPLQMPSISTFPSNYAFSTNRRTLLSHDLLSWTHSFCSVQEGNKEQFLKAATLSQPLR